jgi:tRNA G10  N-methylase Trm11
MCGGGSIGFQITEGWAGAHVWSGDVEPKELRRYAANVERMLSAPSSPASWRSEARRMAGCCWDARRLPIRAGVVDSVVRDWRHPTPPFPWPAGGRGVGTHTRILALALSSAC